MVRKIVKSTLCVAAALFAVTVGTSNLTATEKADKLSVGDIMKKVPGKKGLCASCADLGKAGKWDDAAKSAKEIRAMGEAIVKADKPAKGTAESWKTQSELFKKNVDAIADAVDKKDGKALGEAVGTFGKSCGDCHKNHK